MMADQPPAANQDNSSKKLPDSPLPADIGEMAEHHSTEEQSKTKTEYRILQRVRARMAYILKSPKIYWDSLKSPEVSNRTIAIATIAISVATVFTYFDIHGGGAQTDKIIAADERIAKAMEGALLQSKQSFAAANEQAILSQRAWIHVLIQTQPHKNGQPFVPNEPLVVRVTTKNTGRTPAINAWSVTKRDVAGREANGEFSEPPFTYKKDEYIRDGNITPDQWNYADFVKPFTSEDLKRIQTQVVRMYVHGRIEYEDVFSAHHWISFCSFLLPSGAWANCKDNNDMDQKPN
jgi:hypothetical protein